MGPDTVRLTEEELIPCGLRRRGVRAEGMLSLNGPRAGGMFTAQGGPRLERGGRRLRHINMCGGLGDGSVGKELTLQV